MSEVSQPRSLKCQDRDCRHSHHAVGHPALAQNVNDRQANQQERIVKGVGNGSLNARELFRLERREASIANQEQRIRSRNDGHLTPFGRFVLNKRLNNTSAAIRRNKQD
jgi:hypothetical protein